MHVSLYSDTEYSFYNEVPAHVHILCVSNSLLTRTTARRTYRAAGPLVISDAARRNNFLLPSSTACKVNRNCQVNFNPTDLKSVREVLSACDNTILGCVVMEGHIRSTMCVVRLAGYALDCQSLCRQGDRFHEVNSSASTTVVCGQSTSHATMKTEPVPPHVAFALLCWSVRIAVVDAWKAECFMKCVQRWIHVRSLCDVPGGGFYRLRDGFFC